MIHLAILFRGLLRLCIILVLTLVLRTGSIYLRTYEYVHNIFYSFFLNNIKIPFLANLIYATGTGTVPYFNFLFLKLTDYISQYLQRYICAYVRV